MSSRGIVNYLQVSERLGKLITQEERHQILLGEKVVGIEKGSGEIVVQTNKQSIHCQKLINCAGLHFRQNYSNWAGSLPMPRLSHSKGSIIFYPRMQKSSAIT